MKQVLLCLSFLIASGSAQAAMSGSEFMKAETSPRLAVTKECIQRYVQYGYKKVPDEYELSRKMQELIRRDGLGARGTGTICDEAGKELGMVR